MSILPPGIFECLLNTFVHSQTTYVSLLTEINIPHINTIKEYIRDFSGLYFIPNTAFCNIDGFIVYLEFTSHYSV